MIDRFFLQGRAFAIAVLPVWLGACTPGGIVILLPEKDSRPTAVTVQRGDRTVVLDAPYGAVRESPFGLDPYRSSAQEVEALFAEALAAQPARAARFVLNFVEGKDELTGESKAIVDIILSEIARRPVPDVIVVGHTDLVGNDQFNDALGLQRAEAIRRELLRRGIAPENVLAVSRGKREPLVPTPDGVADERNRRVEIIVR